MDRIIIKSQDFDPSKLTFGEVRAMKGIGAKFSGVTYDGKRLYVQTPEMIVPFGMNQFTEEGKDPDPNASWTLDLSFSGEDDDEQLKALHEKLEQVENHIVDAAYEGKWITDKKNKDPKKRNQSVKKDILKNSVTSQVRYSTSEKALNEDGTPKYPPTMRVKVPCKEGKFMCEAYDDKKTPVADRPLNELLTKGSRAKCLLECGAAFIGQSITLTWRLSQVKVRQSGRMDGYGFLDDSDGEADEDDEQSEPSNEKPTMIDSDESQDDSGNDNDSDSDSDSEDEAPQPVKKPSRKKKN